MLAGMPWFDDALPVVFHHHERFEASGYPQGLRGQPRPIAARLFAAINVFDALLPARPYKVSYSLARTLNLISQGRGTHFDPSVARQFFDFVPDEYTSLRLGKVFKTTSP